MVLNKVFLLLFSCYVFEKRFRDMDNNSSHCNYYYIYLIWMICLFCIHFSFSYFRPVHINFVVLAHEMQASENIQIRNEKKVFSFCLYNETADEYWKVLSALFSLFKFPCDFISSLTFFTIVFVFIVFFSGFLNWNKFAIHHTHT